MCYLGLFSPGYPVWKLLVVFPWLDQTHQAGPSTELDKHTSTGTIAEQMWFCVYLPYSFALLFLIISLSAGKTYFHRCDFFLKIKSLFKRWRHVRKVWCWRFVVSRLLASKFPNLSICGHNQFQNQNDSVLYYAQNTYLSNWNVVYLSYVCA